MAFQRFASTDPADLAALLNRLGDDLTTTIGNAGDTALWGQISNRPSSFPPAAHSHSWGTITGKPTSFPPAAHTHEVADVTGLDSRFAALERDTGWRIMPAFTGGVADPARPGQWSLHRRGNRVDCRLIGVGVTGTTGGFLGPNALPVGFALPANTGRIVEILSQHVTGVVSTVGDTHKLLISNDDISWRGVVSSDGTVSTTAPSDHRGLLHGVMSWVTDDPWPTTLPGSPA